MISVQHKDQHNHPQKIKESMKTLTLSHNFKEESKKKWGHFKPTKMSISISNNVVKILSLKQMMINMRNKKGNNITILQIISLDSEGQISNNTGNNMILIINNTVKYQHINKILHQLLWNSSLLQTNLQQEYQLLIHTCSSNHLYLK